MAVYDNNLIKKRSFHHFTQDERIQALLNEGRSMAYIAKQIGKTRAAVSYEVKHGSAKGIYVAKTAQKKSETRKKNSHMHCKWGAVEFQHYVEAHLKKKQSPELIAHFYNQNNPEHTISVSTIYNMIIDIIYELIWFAQRKENAIRVMLRSL